MKCILVLIIVFGSMSTFSDEPRKQYEFINRSGKFKFTINNYRELFLKPRPTEIWDMIDENSSTKYQIESNLSDKSVIISNNGKYVVIVDDYSRAEPVKSLKVLKFYTDGLLIKEYTLGDLLKSISNISYSASHFTWFFENNQKYRSDEEKLYITTYELRNYIFDIKSGIIVQNEIDKIIDDNTLYLYGPIVKIENNYYDIDKITNANVVTFLGPVNELETNNYEMEIWTLVYGDVNGKSKIRFLRRNYKQISEVESRTIIVKNGEFVKDFDVLLNLCPYRKTK